MLRKIAISLFFMILCGVISSAQNCIDSVTYEKYVDYVNCYYATKYIEKTKNKIKNNNYVTDFNRYKEAFYNMVEVPSDIDKRYAKKATSTIFQVLQKTAQGYYITNDKGNKNRAITLWNEIEKKKDFLDANWNRDETIKNLIALPTDKFAEDNGVSFDSFLKNEQNDLKYNLEKLLPKQETEKVEDIQNVKTENPEIVDNAPTQPKDEQNTTATTSTEVEDRPQVDNIENGENKSVLWITLLIFVVIIGAIIWQYRWLKEKILFYINNLLKKENESNSDTQNEPEQNIPTPKPKAPQKITLQPKDFEKVFNWILKDDKNFEKFSLYIFQNEQLLSLWIKKSMSYPTVRKEAEKYFTPDN